MAAPQKPAQLDDRFDDLHRTMFASHVLRSASVVSIKVFDSVMFQPGADVKN